MLWNGWSVDVIIIITTAFTRRISFQTLCCCEPKRKQWETVLTVQTPPLVGDPAGFELRQSDPKSTLPIPCQHWLHKRQPGGHATAQLPPGPGALTPAASPPCAAAPLAARVQDRAARPPTLGFGCRTPAGPPNPLGLAAAWGPSPRALVPLRPPGPALCSSPRVSLGRLQPPGRVWFSVDLTNASGPESGLRIQVVNGGLAMAP